jgi:hypothetical protein
VHQEGVVLAEESQPPRIVVPPEQFPGRWANHARLTITRHEITLDMIRIGPREPRAEVVSRVSFSPLLFGELVEEFNETWKRYTDVSGFPQ